MHEKANFDEAIREMKAQFGPNVTIAQYPVHTGHADVCRLGIPDRFVEQGTREELYNECGFDAKGIAEAVRQML